MMQEIDPFAEESTSAPRQYQFFLSENAIEKLRSFDEIHNGQAFRIRVHGGGCAGFRYEFAFEDKSAINADLDCQFFHEEICVVLDTESLHYLDNSQLDYKKQLIGAYFTINNPAAKSSCGCGMSFAIA